MLEGGLEGVKCRSLGWMISEKISHVISMVKNHGLGLSCGMSLRRGLGSSFSSLKG